MAKYRALRAIGRAQLACICLLMFGSTVQAAPSKEATDVDADTSANTIEPLPVSVKPDALESLESPDESTDRKQAMRHLRTLVETAEPAVATQAADLLIESLYDEQKYGEAYEVAQIALRRDPDSALAYRFSRIPPDTQPVPDFSFDLGYRFEYDDNITFPDDEFASGEEDFRHVLMADLLYQRPFADNWSFYAQGHVMQSLYNDFDQFNQTRLTGSVAIGQQTQKWGWRLPIEATHDRLDGDSYRTSVAAVPGVYLQFGINYFSHLYLRLQRDDYEYFDFPDEDRSGDVTGTGVLLVGQVTDRWRLRSYLEFSRYDTDGLYWERDEITAFLMTEYEFATDWVAGLAIRYQDRDYDNVRPVFSQRQQDEVTDLYINLSSRFAEKWRWRLQVSLSDHQSNIPIFDYTRNVYSIGITREF